MFETVAGRWQGGVPELPDQDDASRKLLLADTKSAKIHAADYGPSASASTIPCRSVHPSRASLIDQLTHQAAGRIVDPKLYPGAPGHAGDCIGDARRGTEWIRNDELKVECFGSVCLGFDS